MYGSVRKCTSVRVFDSSNWYVYLCLYTFVYIHLPIYRVVQKKPSVYLFRSCALHTALLVTLFPYNIWDILVNMSVKYLDLPCFCTGIVEVRSWGLFSSPDIRSLNRRDFTFYCSYGLGHKTRTNNDQKFVKPILQMRDIELVNLRASFEWFAKFWDSATYLSTL